MIDGAGYAHTNLIARDWRKPGAFYESPTGGLVTWSYVTDPEGNIIESGACGCTKVKMIFAMGAALEDPSGLFAETRARRARNRDALRRAASGILLSKL